MNLSINKIKSIHKLFFFSFVKKKRLVIHRDMTWNDVKWVLVIFLGAELILNASLNIGTPQREASTLPVINSHPDLVDGIQLAFWETPRLVPWITNLLFERTNIIWNASINFQPLRMVVIFVLTTTYY